MKQPLPLIILLTILAFLPSVCSATPTLSPVATTNVGAGMATLILKANGSGTGYFTIAPGSGAACGTGANVKAGQTGSGATALYSGSLPLIADTDGYYTVRNLADDTDYTICFTAESPAGSDPNPTPAAANVKTTASVPSTGPDWRTVSDPGFSGGDAYFTSLAVSPDGTMYVAFADGANGYKATVMKYSEATWNAVGPAGFTAAEADNISLSFAPNGTPHVIYQDWSTNAKATVMRFSNGAWSTVGPIGFTPGTANSVSLAFAPDGTPHVGFGDDVNGGRATVMKFSEGTWGVVGSAGFSTGPANNVSLSFAPDGSLYVAYGDESNGGRATVMRQNGTGWSVAGTAGFSAGIAASPSLAIAPDGTPHLAYSDYGNAGRATVMKLNAGTWVIVGAAGFSSWDMDFVSLGIAPDATPYVAYSDYGNGGKGTVMSFNGSGWSVVANAGFTYGVARSTSLAFGINGAPFLAYADDGNNGKVTVMKLNNPPAAIPTISGTPSATASVGARYTFTPVATEAETFSISGSIPPGLSFSTLSGTLSGTPTTVGTYGGIVITATNSIGSASLPAFAITVSDTTPPDTTITSAPANPTTSTSFAFTFSSNRPDSTFECSLKGGSFSTCASPLSLSALYPQCAVCRADVSMSFDVRAKGITGMVDPTPAGYVWIINYPVGTTIDNVTEGGKVQLVSGEVAADLAITRGVAFTLEGGYDSGYSSKAGVTTIRGKMIISSGTVTVENIAIR